ncbi:MAG: hypothetical protein Q4G04_01425 [bacterium]|nr:hypothetical protein [bacterium]
MEEIMIGIRTNNYLKREIKIISEKINKNLNDTYVELLELGIIEIKKKEEENISEKLDEILLLLKEIKELK